MYNTYHAPVNFLWTFLFHVKLFTQPKNKIHQEMLKMRKLRDLPSRIIKKIKVTRDYNNEKLGIWFVKE